MSQVRKRSVEIVWHDSQFTIHNPRFTIHDSRFTIHNSQFTIHHQVIGRRPRESLPWYFNLCRQRISENGSEHSAFSPTGTAGFHVLSKFAKLYGN
jgi:hypothetical protein